MVTSNKIDAGGMPCGVLPVFERIPDRGLRGPPVVVGLIVVPVVVQTMRFHPIVVVDIHYNDGRRVGRGPGRCAIGRGYDDVLDVDFVQVSPVAIACIRELVDQVGVLVRRIDDVDVGNFT